ncbi:MAG: hypothetical protein JST16_08830 [Bdellovibrionales bacterium]|nr:hypothetical protein [Bdellovibrionales bacterium]
MKNFNSSLILLSLLVSSSAAFAQDSVWLAKLTGARSCERPVTPVSTLGQAVSDLEQNDVQVKEAKTGRIQGRLFCMACGCPQGDFNFVKVKNTDQVEQVVQGGEWEQVDPSQIVTDDAGEANYKNMPVLPTE